MSEVKRYMLYASPVAGGMVMIEATPELRAQYPEAKVYVEENHLERADVLEGILRKADFVNLNSPPNCPECGHPGYTGQCSVPYSSVDSELRRDNVIAEAPEGATHFYVSYRKVIGKDQFWYNPTFAEWDPFPLDAVASAIELGDKLVALKPAANGGVKVVSPEYDIDWKEPVGGHAIVLGDAFGLTFAGSVYGESATKQRSLNFPGGYGVTIYGDIPEDVRFVLHGLEVEKPADGGRDEH